MNVRSSFAIAAALVLSATAFAASEPAQERVVVADASKQAAKTADAAKPASKTVKAAPDADFSLHWYN